MSDVEDKWQELGLQLQQWLHEHPSGWLELGTGDRERRRVTYVLSGMRCTWFNGHGRTLVHDGAPIALALRWLDECAVPSRGELENRIGLLRSALGDIAGGNTRSTPRGILREPERIAVDALACDDGDFADAF
jgi:hypothetical protein